MDLIYYLGDDTQKLPKLLERLGYGVLGAADDSSVTDMIARTNVDLIVIDGRVTPDLADLCTFFRSQEATRLVPIVCISPDQSVAVEAFDAFDRVEVVPAPLSVGTLASRIATQLRLRKTAGDDAKKGTLAEVNAALRDHNSRLQKDLEEARAIQQSLLPRQLPADSRFQLSVSYQPLEQVGGDWYFADFPNQEKLRLHIADVSGHGLPAAFIASMAKLAMVAAERDRPDQLLAAMNHFLAPQLPNGRFITTGTCLYEPATGKLQWARAGHGPALILRRDTRQVQQLLGDGFPLGFVNEATYQLVEEVLAPGDSLLLYTDGVTEAQNRAMAQFGVSRLSEAFRSTPPGASSAEMVRRIVDTFSGFLEGRLLKDDVTLILLKREI